VTTIAEIELRNWGPYRGEHVLKLQDKAYAIVARDEKDHDRSNGLGKSALIGAVRFALYGIRLDAMATEDDWITRGEPDGHVRLLLTDGTDIKRTRTRGKATRLSVKREGLVLATQDEGERLVEQVVGYSAKDFEHGPFMRPRDIAKLVLCQPAERMRVVEAWLELAPLRAAFAHNAARMAAVVVPPLPPQAPDAVPLELAVLQAQYAHKRAKARLFLAQEVEEKVRTHRDIQAKRREREDVVQRGKLLVARLAEVGADAFVEQHARAVSDANSTLAKASVIHQRAQQVAPLARGQFDGKCPVAGIACPAKDAINASSEEHRATHAALLQEYRVADRKVVAARVHQDELQSRGYARKANEEELRGLQARELRLRGEIEAAGVDPEPVDEAAVSRELQEAARAEAEATQAVRAAEQTLLYGRQQAEESARGQQAIRAAEARLQPLREAALVLGPRGAQRRVAEPFLREIEQRANLALAQAGVDLQVKVQWEREGKDPSPTCAACGDPFPSSARVKECSRCGASRGRNIVNELDFAFSNQSEGLEDIWGFVMRLAACAYLRRRRGAAWSTVLCDEPFARLDKSMRRAMSRAVVTMLADFGLRQSIVVSHSPDTQAYPGVIVITRGVAGSRAEVAA
jgi:hypothetical protein